MSFCNVLITGASRGLGLEFVKQFLSMKTSPKNVIATTRSSCDALDQLKEKYPNLHILKYESLDYDNLNNFVEQIKQIVGNDGLDLLINNAGIFLQDTLETIDPITIVKNIENNAVAPVILTQKLLPLLKIASKKRRTIVAQITSGLGSICNNTMGGHYAYRASKAAMNMLSKSLAVDVKSDNIIILLLHPGWVQTDLGSMHAPIKPPTSISGMLKVIDDVTMDETGSFIDFTGKKLPW